MLGKIIAAKIASKLFEGSKNTVANGLRQNMGSIGGFVADRMQREKTDNEHTTTTKKSESIPGQTETKINPKSSTTLDDVAKQVQNAVGVTVNTTKKGFVFVGKHMDGFSNEVSRSLESLGNLLNRLLYLRNKRPTSSPLSFFQEKKKKDDDDGMDWLSILGALYSARQAIRFLRNGKLLSRFLGGGKIAAEALSKPSILKKMLGPTLAPLKMFKFLGGRFIAPLMGAYALYDAHSRDASKESGTTIFGDYLDATLGGAAVGSFFGPLGTAVGGAVGLGLMFASRTFRQTGSISSLEVNKIVFDADKIKFDIVNTLEFKQRIPDSTNTRPIKSAGFFNDLADKYILGGRGNAGPVNNFADRVFGTGPENNAKQNNQSVDKPSVTDNKPSNIIPNARGNNEGLVIEEQGKVARTRKQPISDELRKQLEYAAKQSGVKVKVFSGGQDAYGPNRVGSHRHDHGGSADIKFVVTDKDGKERLLNMENPNDASIMSNFAENAVKAGANGIGAGIHYMGPNSMHVGGGSPLVWGKGGSTRARDIPQWLKDAHARGMKERKTFDKKLLEEKLQAQPMSFGNISPLDNDAASADQTIPWWSTGSIFSRKDDWSWMRKSSNIEDRRNQPNPYKDDQYSIATKESDARFSSFLSYLDSTTNKIPEATLLGRQLGTDLLTPKPPPPPAITSRPASSYNDKEKSTGKQSFYQDNDLDHRTEKRVKETRTFAMYFSTANNTEDA